MKNLARYGLTIFFIVWAAQSAFSQTPRCQGGLGGRFFSSGVPVEVEVLPAEATFTNEIRLYSPGAERVIGTNKESGKVVRLGVFSPGTELVFGIFVRDTQQTFKMGPASRNPDRVAHAQVQCIGNTTATVGFEDKVNSDDIDYDDAVFQIRPAQTDISVDRRPPFDFIEGCNFTNEIDNADARVRSNAQTGTLSVDVRATWFGTATGRAGAGIVYSPANYSGPIRITAEVRLRRNSFDLLTLFPVPFQFGAVSIDSDIVLRAQPFIGSLATGTNRFRSKTLDSTNPLPTIDFHELNRYTDAPTIPVELNTSVVAGRPLLICAGLQSRASSLSALRFHLSSSKGLYDAELLNIKVAPR